MFKAPKLNFKYKPDPESERNDYNLFKSLKNNGISTRKSTDKATLINLQPHQQQINKLVNKYSNITKEISLECDVELSKQNLKGALGFWVASPNVRETGTFFTRLALSNIVINKSDKYEELQKHSITKNWSVDIDDKNLKIYTTTHEFGHLIEENIIREKFNNIKKNKKVDIDWYEFRNKEVTKIKRSVEKICKQNSNSDKIHLSDYSKTNDYEWFAETFTNLELSKDPKPIALALKEYLKERNK